MEKKYTPGFEVFGPGEGKNLVRSLGHVPFDAEQRAQNRAEAERVLRYFGILKEGERIEDYEVNTGDERDGQESETR